MEPSGSRRDRARRTGRVGRRLPRARLELRRHRRRRSRSAAVIRARSGRPPARSADRTRASSTTFARGPARVLHARPAVRDGRARHGQGRRARGRRRWAHLLVPGRAPGGPAAPRSGLQRSSVSQDGAPPRRGRWQLPPAPAAPAHAPRAPAGRPLRHPHADAPGCPRPHPGRAAIASQLANELTSTASCSSPSEDASCGTALARPSSATSRLSPTAAEPMLAFHEDPPGGGNSLYALLDRHYRLVTQIRAQYGYVHGPTRTAGHATAGTAYVAAYHRVLRPRSRRSVTDFVIQEIDLADGRRAFRVALARPCAARRPATCGGRAATVSWDYFHGNSIEPPDRARAHAHRVGAQHLRDLRHRSPDRRGSLDLRRQAGPVRARPPAPEQAVLRPTRRPPRAPAATITLFDNGGPALRRRAARVHSARAQRFRLDAGHRRRSSSRTIPSLPVVAATARGLYRVGHRQRARPSADGNQLINWGTTGHVTEVTRTGAVVFAPAPPALRRYRAVRTPLARPSHRAVRRSPRDRAAAERPRLGELERRDRRSAGWHVLAGAAPDAPAAGGAPDTGSLGLETSHARHHSRAPYVAVPRARRPRCRARPLRSGQRGPRITTAFVRQRARVLHRLPRSSWTNSKAPRARPRPTPA